jgi:outer membrane protein
VLVLVKVYSPLLLAREAAVDAADHRVSASTARLLPRLSLNVRYTRLSYVAPGEIAFPINLPNLPSLEPVRLGDVIENQFASSVVLEQPLFTGLTLLSSREAALRGQEAAAAQLQQDQQDLALRTEEAYFALLRARQLLEVTEQSKKALTAHLERLERLAREGATTPLDVSRTRTRLAVTNVQQLQARAGEAVAQQTLLTLLGLEADVELELTEDLELLPPPPAGDLQAQATTRPDLRAARALAANREAQAKAASGGLWPQVMLRATAQFDSPNPRYFPLRNEFNPSWDASVILTWTAWDWLATWHTQRAAQLDAVGARHAVAQLEDGVRTEVERRRLEAQTAVQRKHASLEAVGVAEQSLQRAQRLCDSGHAPCVFVLDAEAELKQLRAEWVQSRIDLRLASSQLRRAIGTLSLTPEGTP